MPKKKKVATYKGADLGRRKMRYWMSRFKRELETDGAVPADEAPAGMKAGWEADPHFGGWENFHITWDVDEEDFTRVVPLRFSLEQQWNTQAWANARELPTAVIEE